MPPRTWWQWLWGIPRAGYECFLGLWLNRDAALQLLIYTHYVGAHYANSLGDIPVDLWLAVCDNEASAFECWSTTNNNRNQAIVNRQLGSGMSITSILG